MDLTADADFDGLYKLLDEAKAQLGDIGEPLARCGGYLRARAKHRCDVGGPGWEPLSPATLKRKLTAQQFGFFAKFGKRGQSDVDSVITLERKMSRAIAEAERAALNQAHYLGGVNLKRASAFERKRDRALEKAQEFGQNLAELAETYKGMAAGFGRLRITDVDSLIDVAHAEMERRKRHGQYLSFARGMDLQPGEKRVTITIKKKATEASPSTTRKVTVIQNPSKLRRSLRAVGDTRYRRDIRSTQILGSLRDSIHLRVQTAGVIVFSGPSWSGVHNKGGTAGHGAQIKQRQFLMIEAPDVKFCAGIFREYLMRAFRAAA